MGWTIDFEPICNYSLSFMHNFDHLWMIQHRIKWTVHWAHKNNELNWFSIHYANIIRYNGSDNQWMWPRTISISISIGYGLLIWNQWNLFTQMVKKCDDKRKWNKKKERFSEKQKPRITHLSTDKKSNSSSMFRRFTYIWVESIWLHCHCWTVISVFMLFYGVLQLVRLVSLHLCSDMVVCVF